MTEPIMSKAWADSFGRWYCRVNLPTPCQSDDVPLKKLRTLAKSNIEYSMAQHGEPYKIKLEISATDIDSNNRVRSVTFFESA